MRLFSTPHWIMQLATVSLLVQACTPGATSSSSSSSSSSGGSGAVADALIQHQLAQCEMEDRCSASAGRRNVDHAWCVAAAQRWLDFVSSYAPAMDQLYRVDQVALDACLTATGTVGCDASDLPDACNRYLVPLQPIPQGGTCSAVGGTGICDVGLYCDVDSSLCSTCRSPVGIGGACARHEVCHNSDCVNGTCQVRPPRARAGEACGNNGCLGNLVCAGPFGSTTCQPLGNLGDACGNDAPYACLEPLRCDRSAGRCVERLPNAAPCDRDIYDACLNVCHFEAANAPTGTCGDLLPLAAAGEPCDGYSLCAYGTYAELAYTNTGLEQPCTCRARLEDGQRCSGAQDTQCRNHCLEGVCGLPQPEGSGCTAAATCESGRCGFAPGGEALTCLARQCTNTAPACSSPPSNTSVGTATPLMEHTVLTGTYCGAGGGIDYYWRISGPFPAESGLEVLLAPDGMALPSLTVELWQDDGSPFPTFLGNCYPSRGDPVVCAGFPLGPQDVLVKISSGEPASIAAAFQLLYRVVADGEGACSTPPTNTQAGTAVTLQPGTPVEGRFCSRGSDIEYWWNLPGPFGPGDVVQVGLTPVTGSSTVEMDVGTLDNGSFRVLGGCPLHGPGGRPSRCSFLVTSPMPDVYMVTRANPSIHRQSTFTVVASGAAPPPPMCSNAPGNLTMASAAAMTLGTATTGRACSSTEPTMFWWAANGSFTPGQTCRLTVDFNNGATARDVNFALSSVSGDGTPLPVAACQAQAGTNEDCQGQIYFITSQLVVTAIAAPGTSVDESFSMTLTCS